MSIHGMPDALRTEMPPVPEGAFLWVMRYCTWEPPDDPENSLPRPFAGKISPLAFNMLLFAVITGRDDESLPTVRINQATFKDFRGGKTARAAATNELVLANLITVNGPVWTLRIDDDVEGRP